MPTDSQRRNLASAHSSEVKALNERIAGLETEVEFLAGMLGARRVNSQQAESILKWLHSEGSNDVGGYEYGIYKVKWKDGKAVEVWQTNADLSDVLGAMSSAAITSTQEQT